MMNLDRQKRKVSQSSLRRRKWLQLKIRWSSYYVATFRVCSDGERAVSKIWPTEKEIAMSPILRWAIIQEESNLNCEWSNGENGCGKSEEHENLQTSCCLWWERIHCSQGSDDWQDIEIKSKRSSLLQSMAESMESSMRDGCGEMAVSYCSQCSDFLCVECDRQHRDGTVKRFGTHTISSLFHLVKVRPLVGGNRRRLCTIMHRIKWSKSTRLHLLVAGIMATSCSQSITVSLTLPLRAACQCLFVAHWVHCGDALKSSPSCCCVALILATQLNFAWWPETRGVFLSVKLINDILGREIFCWAKMLNSKICAFCEECRMGFRFPTGICDFSQTSQSRRTSRVHQGFTLILRAVAHGAS